MYQPTYKPSWDALNEAARTWIVFQGQLNASRMEGWHLDITLLTNQQADVFEGLPFEWFVFSTYIWPRMEHEGSIVLPILREMPLWVIVAFKMFEAIIYWDHGIHNG